MTTDEGYLFKLDNQCKVQNKIREARGDDDDKYLRQVKASGENIYTLALIPRGEKHSGYIGVFDRDTLKRKKRIYLPEMDNTAVKDFVLLHNK
ncbi:hypothetical protein [Marininema halotolerans]|uniref:hypothetical protein n=1 Tax=Marininema halotolerans TaxID=1155944 RepID=UPI000B88C448|nr:hypothetical protein [Marininema halotolerans]